MQQQNHTNGDNVEAMNDLFESTHIENREHDDDNQADAIRYDDDDDMIMNDEEMNEALQGQSNAIDQDAHRNEIGIADSWIVIGQYFEEKGLVRQQIESYNEFINNTIQEIVDDTRSIVALSEPEMDADGIEKRTKCEIKFNQVYITPPVKIEGLNQEEPLIPHSCRLRHLTYCAEAQVEVVRKVSLVNEETRQEEPYKQPDDAIIHMVTYTQHSFL